MKYRRATSHWPLAVQSVTTNDSYTIANNDRVGILSFINTDHGYWLKNVKNGSEKQPQHNDGFYLLGYTVIPCSPLKLNRHLGGTCRLHLQDRRISQARNQQVASRALHVTFQKTEPFITISVRTSYPTAKPQISSGYNDQENKCDFHIVCVDHREIGWDGLD
jgi:hypothetical protein